MEAVLEQDQAHLICSRGRSCFLSIDDIEDLVKVLDFLVEQAEP